MAKNLKTWKLNIRPFYPLGMECLGSERKFVIMAWDHNVLCTFVFKSIQDSITNDRPPDKFFEIAKFSGQVIDIVAGKHESVILINDGSVMHFESMKSIKVIPNLTNIKCICSTSDGFAMIQVSADKIIIRIHPDSFSKSSQREIKDYDISFDQCYTQSTWNSSQFCIKELRPSSSQPDFFRFLRKSPTETYTESSSFIFFSIDSNFLALIIENDDDDDQYHVNHIQSFSSSICKIYQSTDQNTIFLLLYSGILEVIYAREDSRTAKNDRIFLGKIDVDSCKFDGNVFIYFSETEITQTKLYFCSKDNRYKYDSKIINLNGICALSYVSQIKSIICLSENCTFYSIKHRSCDNDPVMIDQDEFNEVNKEFIEKSQKQMVDVVTLSDVYDRIKGKIDKEMKTFEILALNHNRNNYKNLMRIQFKAFISTHKSTPTLANSNVIYLNENSNFGFIHILIQSNEFRHIFESPMWSLLIKMDFPVQSTIECKNIRMFQEAFTKPLNVIIPLNSQEIPNIKIEFNTEVQLGSELIYISFPVSIESYQLNDLFDVSLEKPLIFDGKSINLQKLIFEKCKKIELNPILLEYKLKTIEMNFKKIFDLFDREKKLKCTADQFYVKIFENIVRIKFNKEDLFVQLSADNSLAMFYVKQFIFKKLFKRNEFLEHSTLAMESIKKELITLSFDLKHQMNTSNESLDIRIRKTLNYMEKVRCLTSSARI